MLYSLFEKKERRERFLTAEGKVREILSLLDEVTEHLEVYDQEGDELAIDVLYCLILARGKMREALSGVKDVAKTGKIKL